MVHYPYGHNTHFGLYVDENIQRDLGILMYFVGTLESHGWELIAFNQQGAIIKERPRVPIISIDELHDRVRGSESNINYLRSALDELRATVPDKSNVEEVTDKFFLLFDYLPEKVKKELKIYIKK